MDMTTLSLRIAGLNGLYALRQMLHLPSDSYLHKWSVIAAFKPMDFKPMRSYKDCFLDAAVANLIAFFLEPVRNRETTWMETCERG